MDASHLTSYIPMIKRNFNRNYKKRVKYRNYRQYFEFAVYLFSSVMNVLSIVLFVIDNETDQSENTLFKFLDFTFACYFALELLVLYKHAPNKRKFLLSFETVLDATTVTSSFLTLAENLPLNLNFLRVFKILKILRMKRVAVMFRRFEKTSELTQISSEAKMRSLLVKTSITLVLIIFISAGFLVVVQEYFANSFGKGKFSFITSFYFIICTSTSIGYGDIVPTNLTGRFCMVILIFIIIYLISLYTSKIVAVLTSEKQDSLYTFTDHNIILGNLEKSAVLKALAYIYKDIEEETLPKTIIVIENNQVDVIEAIKNSEFYLSNVFLVKTDKVDIFSLMRANLSQASKVLCLNQKSSDSEYVKDFLLYNLYNKINSEFEGRIQCQFYRFGYYVTKQRNTKYMLDLNLMKTFLTAEAVFSPGILPFITNLIEEPIEDDSLIGVKNLYSKSTRNRLILADLGRFVDKRFDSVKYAIYTVENKAPFMEPTAHESQVRLDQSYMLPQGQKGPVLLGVLCHNGEVQFNPLEYPIDPGDTGIFLYDDEDKLKTILNQASSKSSPFKSEYKSYASNQINNKLTKEISKNRSAVNTNIGMRGSAELRDIPPFISNHIVILGLSPSFDILITSLKSLTVSSRIVVINPKFPKNNDFKQFISKFTHIYLVEGNYSDINVLLEHANADQAEKVVILGSQKTNSFEADCENIQTARLVKEYLKVPFVIQLNDSKLSKYLVDVWDENSEIGALNGSFMRGEILFKDALNKIALKSGWEQKILFELIKINQKATMHWIQERNVNLEMNQIDLFQCKKKIFCLPVGKKHFRQSYGEFVASVLEERNAFTPLGVVVDSSEGEMFVTNPEFSFKLKPSNKILLLGDPFSAGKNSKLSLFRQKRLKSLDSGRKRARERKLKIMNKISRISSVLRKRVKSFGNVDFMLRSTE